MKSLTAILTALALLGSVALVSAADSCCDKAKKDGKVCEKCNKKEEKK